MPASVNTCPGNATTASLARLRGVVLFYFTAAETLLNRGSGLK